MGFSLGKLRGEKGESNVRSSAVESSDTTSEDVANAGVHLRRMKDQHRWDPFMDTSQIKAVDAALATEDPEKEAAVEQSILQEDSPYLEVRSSVSSREPLYS